MTDQHCCARILFDGEPCDIAEHAAIACKGCFPYVHSDGSWEHEPGCVIAEQVIFTGGVV